MHLQIGERIEPEPTKRREAAMEEGIGYAYAVSVTDHEPTRDIERRSNSGPGIVGALMHLAQARFRCMFAPVSGSILHLWVLFSPVGAISRLP